MDAITILVCALAITTGLFAFLFFGAVGALGAREEELLGHRADLTNAEAENIRLEHERDLAKFDLEVLQTEVDAQPVPTLERFQRRRVVVNSVDSSRAWRGVLREELADDSLVLNPCEVLERTGRDAWAAEDAPGEVVIPAGRIDFVQVVRDDA